jgi:alkyl hydroperoxide reductase subunit AhpC
LADFQSSEGQLQAEGVEFVAASVDPVDKAKELIDKLGITYPVGYGLDAEEISGITGAFFDEEKKYLHATGFLLLPNNLIAVACYSSGAIGRLRAKDVVNLVKYLKSTA